jgi:ABC-2 type transport system ATP-binding protein
MTPAIQARGLTKRYGATLVLDHLDIEVPKGEVYGFLGPNGAGKTTTIRLLLAIHRPTDGTALIDGHDACVTLSRLTARWRTSRLSRLCGPR